MNQSTSPSREMPTRILDAATRLIAQRGYSGTSLQSIADAVGIAKPSLLHHFRSKSILRDAVLDGLIERWTQILPVIMQAATGGKDRFSSMISEAMGFFDQDPDRARVLLREILDRPDEMQKKISLGVVPWVGLATSYIQAGKESGRLHSDIDPEAYLTQIVLMLISSYALAPIADHLVDRSSLSTGRERRAAELIRIARSALFIPRPI